MKYLTERSLYYYFLMREVANAGVESWGFIAKNFGLKPKAVKTYEAVLKNPLLDELSTTGDVEMYKNYLNAYCDEKNEFGKSKCESEAIDMKALALHKTGELFSETLIKGNRLRSLSHNYERDHVATVLYAIHMLYLNDDEQCEKFAEKILSKELEEGKNSDAGLLLLKLESENAADTVARLRSLPDMLLRPDMLKYFTRLYGEGTGVLNDKHPIGF